MELNDLFDNVYCINLDHRKDRWEECNSHFTKHNIKVERFSAINGKEVTPEGVGKLLPGEVGVIRSNYNVIKDAKEKNYKQIVLFEDDVELDPEFKEKFFSFYSAVPDNWSFIYMGGNHVGGTVPINDKIHQIRHSYILLTRGKTPLNIKINFLILPIWTMSMIFAIRLLLNQGMHFVKYHTNPINNYKGFFSQKNFF